MFQKLVDVGQAIYFAFASVLVGLMFCGMWIWAKITGKDTKGMFW